MRCNLKKQIETELLELLAQDASQMEVVKFLKKWPILLPVWFPRGSRVYCDFELPGVGAVDFAYHRPDTPGELWRFIRIADPNIGLRDGLQPSNELLDELDKFNQVSSHFLSLSETGKHTSPVNSFRFVAPWAECYLVVGRIKETGYLDDVRSEDWSFVSQENKGRIKPVTFDYLLCCLDHICWKNPSMIELVNYKDGNIVIESEFLLREKRQITM